MTADATSRPGLRAVLSECSLRSWRPINLPDVFEPRATIKAVRRVERTFSEAGVREPSPMDLEETWVAVRSAWRKSRSLRDLSPRDMRRTPWVLFYPPAQPGSWLARDNDLVREFLSWAAAGHRSAAITALLHQYLAAYPTKLESFEVLRTNLSKMVNDPSRRRLDRWRERCERYGLLDKDGPSKFVGAWRAGTRAADSGLHDAGLDGTLGTSQFTLRSTEHLLDLIRNDLDSAADPAPVAKQLPRQLDWLEYGEQFRFDELRARIAESLLAPFRDRKPDPKIEDQIRPFLLKHFGDPRVSRRKWVGVKDPIVHVMLRWLVKVALEDFFRLLDETALDRHWRYRKAFWSAYLKIDAITDAWVLLGPRATEKAVRLLKGGADGVGILEKGYGVLPDHSVLLMRMSGVTVAEWSHNGVCRFWLDGNRRKPQMYKRSYTRTELTTPADFKQVHQRTEQGGWQAGIADWIASNVGVRMSSKEYMPRIRRR